MSKQILISVESQEKRISFLENNVLEEYYIERGAEARLAGNIYKGRVENVVPGIQAAFVDVGLGKNGFLHVSDVISGAPDLVSDDDFEPIKERKTSKKIPSIADLLKPGQEILVQVVKEPISTKGVRLSTHISLPGRFLVLLPFDPVRGISRRIQERNERVRLREFLAKARLPKSMGLIVRTVSEGTDRGEFAKDIRYMYNTWKEIKKKINGAPCPSFIHGELDLVLKTVRDSLTEDIDRVVVDSKEEYKRIRSFIGSLFQGMSEKVEYYQADQPLFERYGLDKEIEKMNRRKVWLKCGGYIVIDRTEALVAIDVNSGRNVGKDSLEDTVSKTNLEAADEIARQLRLRNIGGIIILDFIDMLSKHNQKAVLKRLKNAIKKDRAKTNILPLSDIGLVEMTRQRIKETLAKEVYTECYYCEGSGVVKTAESMGIEISRNLAKHLLQKSEDLHVEVNPEVFKQLKDGSVEALRSLEDRFQIKIHLNKSESLHIEEFKVFSYQEGKELKL